MFQSLALLAGGNWNNATNCSSRTRNANNSRSNANANIGSQGRIREGRRRPTPRLNTAPCHYGGKIHNGVVVSLVGKPEAILLFGG